MSDTLIRVYGPPRTYDQSISIITATAALLLDTYPNAAFAYSFRKLRTAYAGSAIRLRAGGSNVETDIGFSGNDFDSASAAAQLVVATNLILRSQELETGGNNDPWYTESGVRITVTANSTTAPDGTSTADTLTAVASNYFHNLLQTVTVSASTTYTISCYVKQGTHRYVSLGASNAVDSGKQSLFDLQTGTILSTALTVGTHYTHVSSSITSVGSGWYRLTETITADGSAGTSMNFLLELRPDGTDTSFSPSWNAAGTETVYAWGAQIESGSSATAYIPTGATSVSRDGNGYIVTWYDQSGNALDVTQSTAANQPLYVDSGIASKPTMQPDGSNDTLLSANVDLSTLISSQGTVFGVLKQTGTQAQNCLFGFTPSSGANTFAAFPTYDDVLYFDFGNTTADTSNGRINVNQPAGWDDNPHILELYRDSGDTQAIVVDGVSLVTGTRPKDLTSETAPFYVFTNVLANNFKGQVSELVCWGTDLGGSRSGARTNINSYYSVF